MAFSSTLVDTSGDDVRIYDCSFADGDTTGTITDVGGATSSTWAGWTPEYVLIQPQDVNAGGAALYATISNNDVTIGKAAGAGTGGNFKVLVGRNK